MEKLTDAEAASSSLRFSFYIPLLFWSCCIELKKIHWFCCVVFECSLFAALSYGAASMAMVFINKAVLMEYSHSMTLLTMQVSHSISLLFLFSNLQLLPASVFLMSLDSLTFFINCLSNWPLLCLYMLVEEWDTQDQES